ncbi:MAG TPA: hypothetical protein VHG72_21680 [Polyangia bacterium]|nr:hypothetical protein [Polyangia bacterium]
MTTGSCTRPERRARTAVVILGLLAVVAILTPGCSDESATRHALEADGFTRIETTGWAPLGCSKDDSTCTGFEAVGPSGIRVTGVVGCGWFFKGCTVRFK